MREILSNLCRQSLYSIFDLASIFYQMSQSVPRIHPGTNRMRAGNPLRAPAARWSGGFGRRNLLEVVHCAAGLWIACIVMFLSSGLCVMLWNYGHLTWHLRCWAFSYKSSLGAIFGYREPCGSLREKVYGVLSLEHIFHCKWNAASLYSVVYFPMFQNTNGL